MIFVVSSAMLFIDWSRLSVCDIDSVIYSVDWLLLVTCNQSVSAVGGTLRETITYKDRDAIPVNITDEI